MARLKIGSGIQFEAKLTNEEVIQYIDAIDSPTNNHEIDMEALAEKVKAMLLPITSTESGITKEVDLSQLATKSEMNEFVLKICDQTARVNGLVEDLNDRVNILEEQSERPKQLPEVKQITHVQDVSDDVRKEVRDLIKHTELNLMLKIRHLQIDNMKQSRINKCLVCCILILTLIIVL